ncbi:glycosyltransferase family 39 protein [Pseudovibrio sp. Tun.PSC04-5.I4]|uniref:ArnT family glycosyltransferase n=1 Tax=Pseudovibrio sp. Tun.PSC04-5.I4 TaxID=1798213 RepID=UPI001AD8E37B|nr:glycosyltransferase family 39 protein [Pseudovibrio sp. Tun.PSC04-5.I4]
MASDKWVEFVADYFVWFIAGYFILQTTIRYFASPVLGLDEAEQIIASQTFQLGYGPQPPLYTWLTILFFSVFGKGLFATAFLKNLLLFLGYLAVWLSARKAADKTLAAIGTASLIFLPQISWESQRALSHSVLMFACSAWTLYIFVLCIEKPNWWRALAFGEIVALGAMSKYNYFFLLAALLVSAGLIPKARKFLLSKYAICSALIVVVLLIPPAFWMFENQDLIYSRVHKFGLEKTERHFATGLVSLAAAVTQFVAVAVVLYAGAWISRFYWSGDEQVDQYVNEPIRLLITLIVVFGLTITAVSVFASGATVVKDRWLQPVLFLAPLAAALWIFSEVSMRQTKMLFGSAGALAVLICVLIPLNFVFGNFKKPSAHSLPSLAIVDTLSQYGVRSVLTTSHSLAGNVGDLRPEWSISIPEYSGLGIVYPMPIAVLWKGHSQDVPANLAALYEKLEGVPLPRAEVHREATPYLNWSEYPFDYSFIVIGGKSQSAEASR